MWDRTHRSQPSRLGNAKEPTKPCHVCVVALRPDLLVCVLLRFLSRQDKTVELDSSASSTLWSSGSSCERVVAVAWKVWAGGVKGR